MLRGLVNIFAAIALIAASLLLVLCVHSYSQPESLYFEWGGRGYFLAAANGQLGLIQTSRPFGIATWNFGSYATRDREPNSMLEVALSNDATTHWGIVSLGSGNIDPVSQFMGQLAWLAAPLTLPIILLCLPAIFRVKRLLRDRRRHRRHLCIVCGCDLGASSDRCPECGADIALQPPVPAT